MRTENSSNRNSCRPSGVSSRGTLPAWISARADFSSGSRRELAIAAHVIEMGVRVEDGDGTVRESTHDLADARDSEAGIEQQRALGADDEEGRDTFVLPRLGNREHARRDVVYLEPVAASVYARQAGCASGSRLAPRRIGSACGDARDQAGAGRDPRNRPAARDHPRRVSRPRAGSGARPSGT